MNNLLFYCHGTITGKAESIIANSPMTETLIIETLLSFAKFIPKLLLTFLLLFICFRLIGLLICSIRKIMTYRSIDPSIVKFIGVLISISLKIITIISLAGYLGFDTTSLVTMIAASGLAIGLALQGTLQNFAGGVIILVLKPFKTGDDVEFGGERGVVKEVQLFSTIIEKYGTNEDLIIPNSAISSTSLRNWNRHKNRRIDIIFGVSYGTDLKAAKDIIIKGANGDKRTIDPKLTNVLVDELADSSVNLELRVWCKPEVYIETRSDMIEMIYNTLNENNIDIPFPQMTIHNSKNKEN